MRTRRRIPRLVGGTAVAVLVSAGAPAVNPAAAGPAVHERPAPSATALPLQDQSPDLGPGDSGPEVVEWQEQINAWIEQEAPLRGTIPVDGVFGPGTEQATIDVQQNLEGVEADGTVEQATREALQQDLAEGPTPPGTGQESPPDEATDDVPPVEPGEGPVIGPLSAGPEVTEWQQQVNAWRDEVGLEAIAEDGVYGPITENATRQFQTTREIDVDGLVGPETRTEMQAALAGDVQDPNPPPEDAPNEPQQRLLTQGLVGEDVADWQETLNEWRTEQGITPIAVDGIYGPVTESATRQFQAAFDALRVDGIVGPNTRTVAENEVEGTS